MKNKVTSPPLDTATFFGQKAEIIVRFSFDQWNIALLRGTMPEPPPLKSGQQLVNYCNENGLAIHNKHVLVNELQKQLKY